MCKTADHARAGLQAIVDEVGAYANERWRGANPAKGLRVAYAVSNLQSVSFVTFLDCVREGCAQQGGRSGKRNQARGQRHLA